MSAEQQLARLERQILGAARVSSFLDTVDLLRRMLAQESPEIRARVLTLVAPSIGRDLAAAVGAAWNIGVLDAEKVIGEGRVKGVPGTPPKTLVAAARASEKAIGAELAKARKLARVGADVATVLAPVFAASNVLQRDVTTLVNHAGNKGTAAVADSAGLSTVWVAETNACVECLAYSGRISKPGKPFPGGLTYGAKSYHPDPVDVPPRHPNCLPFDAVVTPGSNVTGASAREYDGEMVRVETLSGNDLSGTPNHPVLTRRGWVGLGFLEPGDEVVSRATDERVIRRSNDREYMPALIGELAQATIGALKVAAREVPMAAVDFHGDGGGSEVCVVATDGMLQDEIDRSLCQHHRELLLKVASERGLDLSGDSGSLESFFGDAPAADGVVRSGGPGEPLLGSRAHHAKRLGLLSSTPRDPIFGEAVSNNGPTDAESIGDAELALAGEVAFDQVVDVDRYAFHGMVYNLETEGGWYIANGIITHNCRCTIEPLVSREYADALRREADRSVLRGFSLESEPMRVRVEAAERLLARGVDAPKSVIAYARRAVKRGEFGTRGRP